MPLDAEFWKRSDPSGARAALVETLQYDLLGPSEPEEEIDESPLTRYLVGMLAPFGSVIPAEEDDSLDSGAGAEDIEDESDYGSDRAGEADPGPPMSQALSPSSIGLSCLVSADVERLLVSARWGDYKRLVDKETQPEAEAEDTNPEQSSQGEQGARKAKRRRPPQRWTRVPTEVVDIPLDLRPDQGLQRVRVRVDDEIYLEHITRAIDGDLTVSIFLVNRRERPDQGRPTAETWIFQSEIEASCDVGARFLPREPAPLSAATDADMESHALLFRHRREFAVGHGTAVSWNEDTAATAVSVATCTLPQFELPRVDPHAIEGVSFDMSELATAQDGGVLAGLLSPLVKAYRDWIATKTSAIADLPPDVRPAAREHVELCTQAADRIQGAIDLLREDATARRAFAFANRAMLLQRSHSEWASAREDDTAHAPSSPTISGAWRPFQLAFVLLTLRGIVEPGHAERQLGDLLWFPTGGGKTEAYLGLAAFTMALRRLRPLPGFRTDAGGRRVHAVHAAPSDDSAVPARGHAAMRVRGHPP